MNPASSPFPSSCLPVFSSCFVQAAFFHASASTGSNSTDAS
jgi:hypothetical protein